jgi:hypothetical protein
MASFRNPFPVCQVPAKVGYIAAFVKAIPGGTTLEKSRNLLCEA